jgi:SAM-dependent methyltransferase
MAVRLTEMVVKEQLASRIYEASAQKCSQSFLQEVEEAKRHFPLLWINIRSHNKVWSSQVEGYANIINNLSRDYPNLALVFDGFSTEKNTVEQILALLPPTVKFYNALDCAIHETIVWAHAIDVYIVVIGSGLVLVTWLANKPGVAHGNSVHSESAGWWANVRENAVPPTFIPVDCIVDLDSSHWSHCDYDFDWKILDGEVNKIVKELIRREVKSPKSDPVQTQNSAMHSCESELSDSLQKYRGDLQKSQQHLQFLRSKLGKFNPFPFSQKIDIDKDNWAASGSGTILTSREEKILYYINKNGQGIEIGPSHNPIAPKKEGYKVHIIDHMNREELIAKYRDHSVNLENIEEVDFVWRGESYCELTGNSKYYDWIIASHVVEHVPNLIGFLNDCESVLNDDGVLSLAIPDKRYCFDRYRPITGISKIIDNYFHRNKSSTPGAVAEYFLNVVSKAGQIAWDASATGEYSFIHSSKDAVQEMNTALNDKAYIDVHAWCFVPHSFRLIIHDLFHLGLISFQEIDFFPTVGCEFHIALGRNGKGINKSRLEMLEIIDTECSFS